MYLMSYDYELYYGRYSGVEIIDNDTHRKIKKVIEEIKKNDGQIYLGEITGKHSEVFLISTDLEKIKFTNKKEHLESYEMIKNLIPTNTLSEKFLEYYDNWII